MEEQDPMEHTGGDAGPAAKLGKRSRLRIGLIFLVLWTIAVGLVLMIQAGLVPAVAGFIGVALVLTGSLWRIRRHLPSILLVFVTVLLVGVVATHQLPKLRADRLEAAEGDDLSLQWAADGTFDPDLPIVVHMVFDEMMSVGAIPQDLSGGPEMRQSLLRFAEEHSFRIFDSVYSRHFFSGDTLPSLMGREYRGGTSLADQTGSSLSRNHYFADLASRGYRTVVFQTDLMSFCTDPNVDMCETLNAFDPGGGGALEMDPRNQRASLWQTIVRAIAPSYTSEVGQSLLRRVYGLRTDEVGVIGAMGRYDVPQFPGWFDRFARFTANVPRGTHVFAHFMVPHSPYLLSERCVVSGTFEGGYYLGKFPPEERDEKRREFYDGYFAQLGCVQHKLDGFMAAITRSEKFRDAVIVIHGDHGSRISIGNILEDYSRRDYVDNYGTFFAVRAPAVQPGVDCEFVSLPEIFRRHLTRVSPDRGPPLSVFVNSRAARDARVEVPMPPFGCAEEVETSR